MAIDRIADAKALLGAKRWSAAYYLAGYSVECGLKSCVLVRIGTNAEIIFDDRRFSGKCWTHNLPPPEDLADLKVRFESDCAADTALRDNWEIVKKWSESSRYDQTSKAEAEGLFDAITDKKHGMLAWIKRHW